MRHLDDAERRARLGRRHVLAPECAAPSPEGVVEAMTVLHATEPATVHLACRARVPGLTVDDVHRALYRDRSLVKQLAMRRTLWVFPRDLLPAAWGSSSARVAEFERRRMAKDVVKAGLVDGVEVADGDAWLDRARTEVLAAVSAAPDGVSALQVRRSVPFVDVNVAETAGSVWGANRVLTHLALTADIVRGHSTAHWRLARYAWTTMGAWLGPTPEPWEAADGYREILRRWLYSAGPATEDDLVWWLGATKGIVRAALAELDAVAVTLDGGGTGWLLPDDVDPVAAPEPWVALLPTLDPTTMGWKARDWYLGPHAPTLFDGNGNAGTTAWVDGRVVGCWVQDPAGRVHVELLEPVPAGRRRELEAEAVRLTDWLDGLVIGTVYPSPAMRAARERVSR